MVVGDNYEAAIRGKVRQELDSKTL